MRIRLTRLHATAALAAGALAAAAAVLLSPVARVIAKQLCDPIAHATSGGAALYTLLFTAMSALMTMRTVQAQGSAVPRSGFALLGLLFIGNAVNTLAHVLALRSLELPITLPVYQWAGADNTYSYLFHSHAGKAAVTALLSGIATPLTLDVGQGWGESLPAWAGWMCGLALASSLVLYLTSLRRLAARFSDNAWVAVLFGLAVLNATKGIVDGGLLSYRVLPSLIVIAALVTTDGCPQMAQRTPAWLTAGGGVLGVYLLLWRMWSPTDASEPWQAFTAYLALLCIPALLAWKPFDALREQCVRPALHAAVLLTAAGFVAQQYMADARHGTGLLWRPLDNDYRALYVDPATLHLRSWRVGGQRPFDVYRQAGDDPLKPRHLLLARDGRSPPAEFALAILSGNESRDPGGNVRTVTPPWRLQASGLGTLRPGLRVVSLNASTPALSGAFTADGQLSQNNYYCLLHGLSAQLRAAGLASFTLAPLRDRADLDSVLGGGAERLLSAGIAPAH